VTSGPAVSCIIIFLDEERFLGDAIASVMGQTWRSWELILVDDGSSDRSAGMARDIARENPERIRYLRHADGANLGMSASRNLGLAAARGRYVGFLDADDVWLPDKLDEQVAILDARPDVGMVYGRTMLWQSWQREPGRTSLDHFIDLGVAADSTVEPPALLVQLIENRYQTPTTCNALIRRSVVERLGGFEPHFRGMFEDQVFFMKVCLAERVHVSSRCWAKYRQRTDSCSAGAERSGAVAEARERLLTWLQTYLRQQASDSGAVWRALDRERFALRAPALHRQLQKIRGVRRALARRLRA
jgi:glycosyltransferase involved in cell wall biosynthesis